MNNLDSFHENKVIPFENMDDTYAAKAGKLLKTYEGNLEWFVRIVGKVMKARADFENGVRKALWDLLEGLVTLGAGLIVFNASVNVLAVCKLLDMDPPKWASHAYEKGIESAKMFVSLEWIPAMGQQIMDSIEEDGIFYAAGYTVGSIIGAKGLDKLGKAAKVAARGTKTASILETATCADDLLNAGLNTVDDLLNAGVKSLDDLVKVGVKSLDDLAKIGIKSIDDLVKIGVNSADDLVKIGVTSVEQLKKLGINSMDDLAKLGITSNKDLAKVGVKSAEDFVKGGSKANIGNKLDYLFGKARGNKHNIERAKAMKKELSKIGIHDTSSGREYVSNHLKSLLNDSTNISKVETRSYVAKELPGKPVVQYNATTRESLLMGPGGAVMVESVWDGNRLLTVIVKGGH
ncbi:hypothetical protein [Anaerosacchariphilus polymeriproducens]|uniref:Pre-toxin TG domain-containing protein n=1 Tax=Anaerosacchariphilus polymeriproducens TaxID=1812858 RepID=A0A371AYE9_9FIRM|nr:hypothetical protein [Anaerosacchariphilus polymeriproducens]RDU24559.1 hypothetical protein DWV06_03595 [Anaerosacchariphilus polymeriproducens]